MFKVFSFEYNISVKVKNPLVSGHSSFRLWTTRTFFPSI